VLLAPFLRRRVDRALRLVDLSIQSGDGGLELHPLGVELRELRGQFLDLPLQDHDSLRRDLLLCCAPLGELCELLLVLRRLGVHLRDKVLQHVNDFCHRITWHLAAV